MTNSVYPLDAMAQLYRDRADAENGFGELKNQLVAAALPRWIGRCQSSACIVAPVCNWRSWYCRVAKPEARMETMIGRALLLATVGEIAKHAGRTTVDLTPMHAARRR